MSVFSKAALMLGIAMLVAAPSAFGQRQITTSVSALSNDVTYSTATDTYVVGYTVTVSNSGSSNVNNVRFVGTTSVDLLGTDASRFVAGFKGAEGITCASYANPNNTVTVECQLGTLAAGSSSARSFAVFFYSPVNAADTFNRFVTFDTYTYYAEGTTDSQNSSGADTYVQTVSTVKLGTPSAMEVKSALTPDGGTFYTGYQALTTASDQFAVGVNVPGQQQKYSSVTLLEDSANGDPTCSSQRNFNSCYKATIEVPNVVFTAGSGNYLTMLLRVDSANIKKGAKIDKVVIRYYSAAVPDLGIPAIDVPNLQFCAKDLQGNPVPNTNYEPCIAKAVSYSRKTVPGWTADLDGDFEWTILNLKNGDFNLF